jgi:hypothetical protein
MIIIIMTGEKFVAHLDGLGGTPVAHHWTRAIVPRLKSISLASIQKPPPIFLNNYVKILVILSRICVLIRLIT